MFVLGVSILPLDDFSYGYCNCSDRHVVSVCLPFYD